MKSLSRSRINIAFIALSLVVALAASSCRMDVFLGPDGAKSTPKPGATATTDGGTSASDALPPIGTVTVLSTTPTPTFDTSRQVAIDILPVDTSGNPILDQGMVVQVQALNDGSATPVTLAVTLPYVIHPGSSRVLPWAVILDLDSSGSMTTTDPLRLRVSAAKAFVGALLASRPTSQIAIADFGAGASGGFAATRWLADFSNSVAGLAAAIDLITESGATPLYESANEMLAKLHAEKPLSDFQPMMLVFSDGAPTTTTDRAAVYANAQAWGIPIHAVSLGDASVKATMAELASQTGGIYADAADANAIQACFNAVVVAKDKGYLSLVVTYPSGRVPLQSSALTITVRSGTKTGTATTTLHL